METRVAVISIIVGPGGDVEGLNRLLTEYGKFVIGRMGIPYREKNVSIISVVLDAPQDKTAALAGKIGNLPNVTVKTALFKRTGVKTGDGSLSSREKRQVQQRQVKAKNRPCLHGRMEKDIEKGNMTDNKRESDLKLLIEELAAAHSLSFEKYRQLIEGLMKTEDGYLSFGEKEARTTKTGKDREPAIVLLTEKAAAVRKEIYGDTVFTRGLIEISNICKNDCCYCGIRKSNRACDRYRLTEEQIIGCADEGYGLGFRTFVLQGGEDPYFTDEVLIRIISRIKEHHPDCAVTLSMGERSYESYLALHNAGADRYLLRHETADKAHYQSLHPAEMSFDNRMRCLRELKEIGYQVGCGFMVGSPGQTTEHLAKDLKFIEEFKPDMCGIGPFIPHKDTPFKDKPAGTLELTCCLLSIIRLIHPPVLLPATTALGTIHPLGREMGIKAGANVVMPNLSPVTVRDKYMLYDNKICTGEESAQCRGCLDSRMRSIGYRLVTDRGDIKKIK